MVEFTTHDGKIVSGKKLQKALNKVADDWIATAKAIYKKDLYASHVTEEEKLADIDKAEKTAQKIRNGEVNNFTFWQRINYELTDECIGFLPK